MKYKDQLIIFNKVLEETKNGALQWEATPNGWLTKRGELQLSVTVNMLLVDSITIKDGRLVGDLWHTIKNMTNSKQATIEEAILKQFIE